MAYRSEQNRIGNKQNFKDLNMSQFPNAVDTRANNTNMRGFINVGEGEIPDWVMAEYVNSSQDAIMALQRALGVTPMVPFDTPSAGINAKIEGFTVSNRIARIEDGLFDVRYGGPGWTNVSNRPTLSKHNHDGLNGHPAKINLQKEVEGLLLKRNIELSSSAGLTGADIYLSPNNPIKINDAMDDFLSKTKGGTIYAPVNFNKGVKTRTTFDISAEEMELLSNVSLSYDSKASNTNCLTASSAGTSVKMFQLSGFERQEMLFGKYFCAVRLKLNASTNGSVFRFTLGNNIQTVNASELVVGGYKQIYFVYEQDEESSQSDIQLHKLATASNVGISLDSVFIQPIHPAVLDR